jgi:cell division septation protein DedD
MFRWMLPAGMLVSCLATTAVAQVASGPPVDPVFARAQALVSDGNGAAGRALVDSVLRATPPNASLYPQALFWRASLASNAADAESDYKHIVVDYPLAPQAEDALLRLAQLELARGDRDAALAHLQRIPRDYPRSKSLARANYWTARVLFEKNEVANACAANSHALAQAATDEVELRNQIQYQSQRCPRGEVSVSARPPQVDAPKVDTVSPSAAVPQSVPDPVNSGMGPRTVESNKSATPTAEVHSGAGGARSGASAYSVQVAAYNHKADAGKLVAGLLKRGYEARVDGDIIPFRVRIGRYATATEAGDALKKMRARHIDGFVVRAPER